MRLEKAEEVRSWLVNAEADLRAAGVDLSATPPLIGDAMFHCQDGGRQGSRLVDEERTPLVG